MWAGCFQHSSELWPYRVLAVLTKPLHWLHLSMCQLHTWNLSAWWHPSGNSAGRSLVHPELPRPWPIFLLTLSSQFPKSAARRVSSHDLSSCYSNKQENILKSVSPRTPDYSIGWDTAISWWLDFSFTSIDFFFLIFPGCQGFMGLIKSAIVRAVYCGLALPR